MFRNFMISFKKNMLFMCFCITLQVILGVILSYAFLLYNNTIYYNGSWISTKTNLVKAVMGAHSFSFQRQALAKGRLNLGAWHGFQEIIYKDKLDIKSIEFDFSLEPNSYSYFIFNKNDKKSSAIRLSINKNLESKYLVISALGRFLEKVPIDTPTLRAQRWYNAKLRFNDNEILFFLDNKEIARFREPILHEQRIGFRGGFHNAYIDNVIIHQHNSKSIYEFFDNRKNAFHITAFFLILVGMCNGLVFLLLYFTFRIKGKNVVFFLAMLDIVLIIISALGVSYLYITTNYYPQIDENKRKIEEYWKGSRTGEIVEYIRNTYGEIPNKNTYRILFIGSSQTWGAGVSKQTSTFVRKIENKLNKSRTKEIQFECINAGISALHSFHLLDLYKREWLKLKPRIVVINLSNNDVNIDIFASNLQRMIKLSAQKGIQPIFVLEANSVEKNNTDLILKHEAMRRVATKHFVPVIDMHAYLSKKYDEGFLWWDFVHLTDFGQELLAEELHKELWQVIKDKRLTYDHTK